ncbi:MAG: gamma-glutamyltransferase family protein [Pseudomonadota bacterium]
MTTTYGSHRPPVMGTHHVISSGHPLSAAAGYRLLEQGGNAVDAGVASGVVINVVLADNTNFGGVAPIMIYLAERRAVTTISGLGRWPKAASIEFFKNNCDGELPADIRRAVVPAAPDAWLTALQHYGTMTLEEVLTPALEIARDGYPLSPVVRNQFLGEVDAIARWPANREIFLRGGEVPPAGTLIVQPALARTFERLIDVERKHAAQGRETAIRAARDEFYRGDIAREMARYSEEQGGLLRLEDFHDFSVKEEPHVRGTFRDYEILACGPWCQGPVVPQTLQMLERDDLASLGHNSADYIHLLAEVLNLSFSDRDYYFGDPDLVDVPMDALMAQEYTRNRRERVDMRQAFGEMPSPGLINDSTPWGRPEPRSGQSFRERETDTSYTCVVDQWGNAFSATPSDANARAPIAPDLGFSLSGRGTQSWLDENHASKLEPWKRPRLTPNPAIAFRDGKLFMPFGCPGGDAQCQAMVQTFLNIAVFGMDAQTAIEAPRFTTWSFPDSFWPHDYLPGRLHVESRVETAVTDELSDRGHDVRRVEDWEPMDMGVMSAITVDPETSLLTGGADPRRDAYAIGR